MIEDCRPAVPGDAVALAAIDRQSNPSPWSETYWSELCARPRADGVVILVLEQEDRVIAFIAFQRVLDEGTLLSVAVHRDYRRRGLAGRLLGAMRDELLRAGARRCLLEVRRCNRPARALYERWGFALDGVREGYYAGAAGREDALLMSLRLEE